MNRSQCRRRDDEKTLFRYLDAHRYLPAIKDAAPYARLSTASHLRNGSGELVRQGRSPQRAARSNLIEAGTVVDLGQ